MSPGSLQGEATWSTGHVTSIRSIPRPNCVAGSKNIAELYYRCIKAISLCIKRLSFKEQCYCWWLKKTDVFQIINILLAFNIFFQSGRSLVDK